MDRTSGTTRKARFARNGERGAALVLVLWFTLFASLVAAAVTRLGQTDLKVALNVAAAAKAEAMAEGGIHLAVAALSRRETADPWPVDGSPRQVEFAGGTVSIAIRDESSKVNPATAPAELLQDTFVAAGIDPERATELAAMIVGERDAGMSSNRLSARRNNPSSGSTVFLTLDDVGRAAGMTEREFRAVREHLSLFAPSRVSRSLLRQDPRPENTLGTAQDAETSGFQATSRTGLYEISSGADLAGGARVMHRAVVRIVGAGQTRVQILSWE